MVDDKLDHKPCDINTAWIGRHAHTHIRNTLRDFGKWAETRKPRENPCWQAENRKTVYRHYPCVQYTKLRIKPETLELCCLLPTMPCACFYILWLGYIIHPWSVKSVKKKFLILVVIAFQKKKKQLVSPELLHSGSDTILAILSCLIYCLGIFITLLTLAILIFPKAKIY